MAGVALLAVGVPAALHVRAEARQDALAQAERQAGAIVAALAVTTSPDGIGRAIAAEPAWHDRLAVHGLGPDPLGHSRASADDLRDVTGQPGIGQPTEGQPGDGQPTDDQTTTGEDTAAARATGADPSAVVEVDGGLAYLRPVGIGDGRLAVAEVFVPRDELSRGVAAAWWWLAGLGLAVLTAVMLANDRVARRTVTSTHRLASAARALGDGELEVRAPVRGHREVAEAAASFNVMADRVAAQLTAERELIADRSHRLRTPLTALRLEVERLRASGTAFRLAQAVDAMEREVDHVIRTARHSVDAGPIEQEEHCDAAEVVRERMSFWSAVAEDQSRPFSVFGTAFRAPVPLPRSELAAALDALLGNVFRYTPQGTAFEVEVSRRDGRVAVRVDDAGTGIDDPKGALRRGVSARGSTGLGLDIVRAAAEAGRGALHIDRAALGGASVVMLLADAQAPRPVPRQRLGFVGRLSREPDERRWGRRAASTVAGEPRQSGTIRERLRTSAQLYLMSFLSLVGRLSARLRRR